jgi:hypothetical protein
VHEAPAGAPCWGGDRAFRLPHGVAVRVGWPTGPGLVCCAVPADSRNGAPEGARKFSHSMARGCQLSRRMSGGPAGALPAAASPAPPPVIDANASAATAAESAAGSAAAACAWSAFAAGGEKAAAGAGAAAARSRASAASANNGAGAAPRAMAVAPPRAQRLAALRIHCVPCCSAAAQSGPRLRSCPPRVGCGRFACAPRRAALRAASRGWSARADRTFGNRSRYVRMRSTRRSWLLLAVVNDLRQAGCHRRGGLRCRAVGWDEWVPSASMLRDLGTLGRLPARPPTLAEDFRTRQGTSASQ